MKKQIGNFQQLAQEPDLQAYGQKPVQNYGINLLKDMGFDQRKGIGKTNKSSTQILVLKPRAKGLGLGAENDEKKEKKTFEYGEYILILEGTYKNLIGQVTDNDGEKQQLQICLYPSNSTIKLKYHQVKKITPSQMKEEKKKFNQLSKQQKEKKFKRLKWIIPQIRVKVVQKTSQYYLKKMLVTEILDQRRFQCRNDEGKFINDLREKDVQTALPKTGGIVIILKGNQKGEKAKLLQREKGKNRVLVQTEQELEMIKLSEDDVAQYVQI